MIMDQQNVDMYLKRLQGVFWPAAIVNGGYPSVVVENNKDIEFSLEQENLEEEDEDKKTVVCSDSTKEEDNRISNKSDEEEAATTKLPKENLLLLDDYESELKQFREQAEQVINKKAKEKENLIKGGGIAKKNFSYHRKLKQVESISVTKLKKSLRNTIVESNNGKPDQDVSRLKLYRAQSRWIRKEAQHEMDMLKLNKKTRISKNAKKQQRPQSARPKTTHLVQKRPQSAIPQKTRTRINKNRTTVEEEAKDEEAEDDSELLRLEPRKRINYGDDDDDVQAEEQILLTHKQRKVNQGERKEQLLNALPPPAKNINNSDDEKKSLERSIEIGDYKNAYNAWKEKFLIENNNKTIKMDDDDDSEEDDEDNESRHKHIMKKNYLKTKDIRHELDKLRFEYEKATFTKIKPPSKKNS